MIVESIFVVLWLLIGCGVFVWGRKKVPGPDPLIIWIIGIVFWPIIPLSLIKF